MKMTAKRAFGKGMSMCMNLQTFYKLKGLIVLKRLEIQEAENLEEDFTMEEVYKALSELGRCKA